MLPRLVQEAADVVELQAGIAQPRAEFRRNRTRPRPIPRGKSAAGGRSARPSLTGVAGEWSSATEVDWGRSDALGFSVVAVWKISKAADSSPPQNEG